MACAHRGLARRTRPAGAHTTGCGCRADAAGLRARGWIMGGGPCARPALAGWAPAAFGRQRRHGLLEAMATLHLVDHPLVQHKLTLMRRKEASTNNFRQ